MATSPPPTPPPINKPDILKTYAFHRHTPAPDLEDFPTTATILQGILIDLLNEISLKTTYYYLVNINSYRKLIYNGLHEKLSIDIQPYYKQSTKFYLNREMTWHSFIIILKHICKVLGLKIIQYSAQVFHIYTPYITRT